MALVLVSDTSVLIDLERGDVIEAAFQCGHELAVPDILYERELKPYNGKQLIKLGLRRVRLEGAGLQKAVEYQRRERRISLSDSLALVIAKQEGSTLLTGDAALRALAEAEAVECHGLLWLFDVFEEKKVLTRTELHVALSKIAAHPRCRLPKRLITERLALYAGRAKR